MLCLWATKKIFLLFLHMNSNSCKNEILADARMKSANADEIFGFASDEIKSTHSPSRRISSNEVGFHCRRRFHPPARVDLVEKSTDKVDAFFWRRRRDLNSRDGFPPYTLSRGASSPAWVLLHGEDLLFGSVVKSGGGSEIRTHGSSERVTGFQDQLLKPLGHPSTTVNGINIPQNTPFVNSKTENILTLFDIISVTSYAKRISSLEERYHVIDISPVP